MSYAWNGTATYVTIEPSIESPCPTKLLWTRVQGSIVRTLNDMTLADLVRPFSKEPKEKLTV